MEPSIRSKKNDLNDLCKVKFEEPTFKGKLQTFYNVNRPLIKANASSNDLGVSAAGTDSSAAEVNACMESKKGSTLQTRQVHITEIEDPKTFHVQDFDFVAEADEIMKKCNQCALENRTASIDTFLLGEMCLVPQNNRSEWYRGVVKEHKKLSSIVYLADYGRSVEVMTNK